MRNKMENLEKIQEKANWCLQCKARPCAEKGCPVHTNIPEFISKIKEEKFKEAYDILQENNIFSHICGTICPQEEQCEGSCIRGIKQIPTSIGELEKFVNEWAEKNSYEFEYKVGEEKNKNIAIIGSGPAGLECAYELRKNGYKVTIFEKDEDYGGILRYGIPDFRLSKDIIQNIIDKLKKMGIVFRNNTCFGKDIKIDDLKNEFDAIFLGIGAEKPSTYDLGDFESIYDSDTFLRAYNNKKYLENLGDVVVIGGGNVAMDSARAAIRMKTAAVISGISASEIPAALLIAGGAVGAGFLAVSKISGEAMGYGDSILITILGGFLGFWNILSVLTAAFLLAAVFSAVMLVRRGFTRKSSFPFVPFLTAAYIGVLLTGGF